MRRAALALLLSLALSATPADAQTETAPDAPSVTSPADAIDLRAPIAIGETLVYLNEPAPASPTPSSPAPEGEAAAPKPAKPAYRCEFTLLARDGDRLTWRFVNRPAADPAATNPAADPAATDPAARFGPPAVEFDIITDAAWQPLEILNWEAIRSTFIEKALLDTMARSRGRSEAEVRARVEPIMLGIYATEDTVRHALAGEFYMLSLAFGWPDAPPNEADPADPAAPAVQITRDLRVPNTVAPTILVPVTAQGARDPANPAALTVTLVYERDKMIEAIGPVDRVRARVLEQAEPEILRMLLTYHADPATGIVTSYTQTIRPNIGDQRGTDVTRTCRLVERVPAVATPALP